MLPKGHFLGMSCYLGSTCRFFKGHDFCGPLNWDPQTSNLVPEVACRLFSHGPLVKMD